MKNIHRIFIFCALITVLVPIVVVAILVLPMAEGFNKTILPKAGIWYCEELEISLNFDDTENSTAVIQGVPARCTFGAERGSNTIFIAYQSSDVPIPGYKTGESFFGGTCTFVKNGRMCIHSIDDDIDYWFILQT